MEFVDDEIRIDKSPSALDALILDVADVLDEIGIRYAVVSGYVAVLVGRSRATEDIDVIAEPFDEETADELATRLGDAGYWGSAMPLDALHETLADGAPFRIAEDGHRVPNVELKFASDEYDYASLDDSITVRLRDRSLVVGSLELQIAYKLYLGTRMDFEDALHLYEVLGANLNRGTLETYVTELGVTEEYERLV